MEIIQHTHNWVKGETFEGTLILIAGLLMVIGSFLFWKFGTTLNSKYLTYTLLLIGLLFSIGISIMFYSSKDRMDNFEEQYSENPTQFIQHEKERVEDFQSIYIYSAIFSAICFGLTIFAFLFLDSKLFQAITIGLMIIGASLIIIDYFSKERANIYYQHILKEI